MAWTRREFVGYAGTAVAAAAAGGAQGQAVTGSAFDHTSMRELAAFTAESLKGPHANPFGCRIVKTATGEMLMQALNAVGEEHDPSAHAELRTIRLACTKLGSASLKGYTLYTTCEPCAMCMSCALWAGLDRVVYGATIADGNRHVEQILIPAAEVARRADMKCVVDGPLEREACLAIFEDARMLETFRRWKAK